MKIALQFSRSCARGRVPEVLTITLINIISFASSRSCVHTRVLRPVTRVRVRVITPQNRNKEK